MDTPGGPVGTRRVGIRDVAREAEVSLSTVSNVMLRPEIVSQSVRKRVLQAIDDLGYVPSATARSLRHGRSQSLGAVFFDLANPFFARLVRSMNTVTAERGYALSVMNTDQNPSLEQASLNFLVQHGIRAAALTSSLTDLAPLRALQERGLALLLVAQRCLDPDIGWVGVDDRAATRALTEHVLATGRRRIGFVDGPGRALQHQQRGLGVIDALTEAGMELAEHLVTVVADAPDIEGGRCAARELLGAHPQTEALICINDYTAIGAMSAAVSTGRRVPEDIAVTGFDDIDVSALLTVPLTTVHQPLEEMGRRAAESLIDLNEGRATTLPQLDLGWRIVRRESTGAPDRST